ncbi:hypothetical protein BGZ60DRAFT_520787 [Tricladium varicosporioides]|nr:hypothetical protein BGZ60DRAFT_520787 [Hymenoscyphus varicosporioides]
MFSELVQRFSVATPARPKKKPKTRPNNQKPKDKKHKDQKPKEKKPKKGNMKDDSTQQKHARDFSFPGQRLLNDIATPAPPNSSQIEVTLLPSNPTPLFFETWKATAEAIFIPMTICLMALAVAYTLYSLILKGTEVLFDMWRGDKLGEESDYMELLYNHNGELRLSRKTEL